MINGLAMFSVLYGIGRLRNVLTFVMLIRLLINVGLNGRLIITSFAS